MLHFSILFATTIFSMSDRDNFWGTEAISPKTQYAEVDEQGITKLLLDAQVDAFWQSLEGKRVLFLVHGFSSLTPYTNYHNIRVNIENLSLSEPYDQIIGYFWPCYDDLYEYFSAKQILPQIAPRLEAILTRMQEKKITVDVMAHSMGNRLLFEALNHLKGSIPYLRNVFCLAPAIDNESLEEGQCYFPATLQAQNIYSFFSRRDEVLQWAYSLSELDHALGFSGAEDPKKLPKNVHTVDCSEFINEHSAYMLNATVYERIGQLCNQD